MIWSMRSSESVRQQQTTGRGGDSEDRMDQSVMMAGKGEETVNKLLLLVGSFAVEPTD
jgi:hypothetical protein